MYAKFFLCVLLNVFLSSCSKEKKSNSDMTEPTLTADSFFVKGADMSWLTEMEAAGINFYSTTGVQTEPMALVKSYGINTIRLRVWVNPTNGWNGTADVVSKALRAKSLGLHILIDFHYSDAWADPGKQTKPAAWASLDFIGLKAAVAAHTKDVLSQLKTAGVKPEWVQVGNETNDGKLWPDGKASSNISNYAQLISEGYDAIKNVFLAAKVMVHLSNGWDNALYRWNINGLISNGAKFDMIGMSLYPQFVASGWAIANQQCFANMNDIVSRYKKEVMIVEAGMPWDDAETCKAFLEDLIAKTKLVAGNNGKGVIYWEPQCYGAWQGYSLGAFDNSGQPTVALEAFKN